MAKDKEKQKIPTVFDTDKASLGDVYAKALLGVGEKSGKSEKLIDELSAVAKVVRELPKLQTTLESPQISADAKQAMLQKAFDGKLSKDTVNFLKVIGSKGRFDCLSQISSSAKRLYNEMSGNVHAEVITAAKVDKAVVKDIAAQLEKALGKKVTLKAVVDPKIIGGMVIRIGDTIHDGSVVNQLEQVRSKAVKRASDAIRGSLDKFMGA